MRPLLALCLVFAVVAETRAQTFTVLVYNVENLTAADGRTLSEDYGPSRYSRAHLLTKLNNIARVIARFDEGKGPDVILFQEIERDFMMDQYLFDHAGMLRHFQGATIEEMLGRDYGPDVARVPVEGLLLKTLHDRGMKGYRVAAADDAAQAKARRHVAHLNVVFTRFPIAAIRTHMVPDMPAILEVQLEINGYPLYLFNNHWIGDALEEKAEDRRVRTARILRARLDDILAVRPDADIIIGGDFSCFYNHGARLRIPRTALSLLGSQHDKRALRGEAELYNLWYDVPSGERGSEIYNGVWSTFMQMMISRGLFDFYGVQYVNQSFRVAEFPDLNMTDDGRPWRWSFKGSGAGFSEHFPVSAQFTIVRNNRTDLFINLTPPRAAAPRGK
jgi:endonuclease/exonuclease/phosphatase family metal-dependent hydrolase